MAGAVESRRTEKTLAFVLEQIKLKWTLGIANPLCNVSACFVTFTAAEVSGRLTAAAGHHNKISPLQRSNLAGFSHRQASSPDFSPKRFLQCATAFFQTLVSCSRLVLRLPLMQVRTTCCAWQCWVRIAFCSHENTS